MKVCVIGNVNLNGVSVDVIDITINELIQSLRADGHSNLVFMFGGAEGVSSIAEDVVKYNKYDTVVFKPWSIVDHKLKFHPSQFFFRNKQAIDNSDIVVFILTRGVDTETKRAMDYCVKHKLPYSIVEIN